MMGSNERRQRRPATTKTKPEIRLDFRGRKAIKDDISSSYITVVAVYRRLGAAPTRQRGGGMQVRVEVHGGNYGFGKRCRGRGVGGRSVHGNPA